MESFSETLFKCIYKIYFTTVLLIFKNYRLPKCISRFIITEFFENNKTSKFEFKKIKDTYPTELKFIRSSEETEIYKYKYYYNVKYFYTNNATILKECLITNFKNVYLDKYFSTDHTYSVYELNPAVPADYMVNFVKLLANLKSSIPFSSDKICIFIFSAFDTKIVADILDRSLEKISYYVVKANKIKENKIMIENLEKEIKNLENELKNF